MLYPKDRKLDPGINSELRMLKMENQRVNTLSLMSNLSKFAITLEQLSNIELKIAEDLTKLYSVDSIYGDLVYNLSKALGFKADIVKREVKSLKDSLGKHKNMEAMYNPLRPLIKHYFKSIDTNEHYNKKLPKVIDLMEGKKKIKGELSNKETEKIVRNKRKLENAQTDLKVVKESIHAETDKLNLERFEKLNQVTKEFINTELSTTFLMTEKYGMLDNFDALLMTKETGQFNEKYFMDIKSETRSQFTKSNEKRMNTSKEQNQEIPVKQNIQNNYYYINRDEEGNNIRKFNPDDVITMRDSQMPNRQEPLSNSNYMPNNSQSGNMIAYPNAKAQSNVQQVQPNKALKNDSVAPNDNNTIALPYQ